MTAFSMRRASQDEFVRDMLIRCAPLRRRSRPPHRAALRLRCAAHSLSRSSSDNGTPLAPGFLGPFVHHASPVCKHWFQRLVESSPRANPRIGPGCDGPTHSSQRGVRNAYHLQLALKQRWQAVIQRHNAEGADRVAPGFRYGFSVSAILGRRPHRSIGHRGAIPA